MSDPGETDDGRREGIRQNERTRRPAKGTATKLTLGGDRAPFGRPTEKGCGHCHSAVVEPTKESPGMQDQHPKVRKAWLCPHFCPLVIALYLTLVRRHSIGRWIPADT